MNQDSHVWSFSMVGGVKRVNLESGNDLVHLGTLDPKLWTALSCPVDGLEIDRKTLELIDTDKDSQIRVPDVIDAVNWMVSVLKDPADILKQEASFPLSAINTGTEEGKMLYDSAKVILRNLGKENEDRLTPDEASDMEKIFATTRFNGDGIITAASADSEQLAAIIADIIQCLGGAADRSGQPGISEDNINAFFDAAEKYAAWNARKQADAATILPIDGDTAAAYENYCAIKSKVDDYFVRCRLATFDAQTTSALNLQVARVESISDRDLNVAMAEIAAYPLAKIEAGRALPLNIGLNPAWHKAMDTFRALTANKLLAGKDAMTEQEWEVVEAKFAPYAQWLSEKDGTAVEPLGLPRVNEIFSSSAREDLLSLIVQDKALEQEANNILMVNRLVRYYRDLFTLLKNFVTFFDFYNPGTKAIFQAGSLYIDQRSCDLCIRVRDMGRQGMLASLSGMYLAYCECVSKSTGEKMTIVAALTNGDVDDLIVGRNALFYDRTGNDWDATIIKIIDNPISIRQAFFSPYRKLSRFIEKQINKVASSQDDKVTASMEKKVDGAQIPTEDPKAKKEPPVPFDVGKFVGIFAAIGLALGAIGTVLAGIFAGFMKLEWWKMPIAVLGIILLISGPSMVIAYLKLRKRNLAPILDANGWAINARVKVNIQFGNTLTHLAVLPPNAKVNINDPFTKKKKPVLPALLFLIAVAAVAYYLLWKHGLIHIHF
jgi:hypothetical protein